MSRKRGKVVVAMSGGVDSSVAAALLLREGYEVMGVFMRLGSPYGVAVVDGQGCETDLEAGGTVDQLKAAGQDHLPGKHKQGCCSVLDAADARRVAGILGVPFYVLNFEAEFGRVIDYFVGEYNSGRTPNPCVRCNDWLKFGKLAQYAEAVGAEYVASGHYARIGVDEASGERSLFRGVDVSKDQSYVLFGMSRTAMRHTLLPIGGYAKSAVRAIAEEMALPVFNKPDSQEICFVPDQDYASLVRRRAPEAFARGELVTPDGEVVGRHEGHQHFTIGQRRGTGLAAGYPLYVLDIDVATNRVTVGARDKLERDALVAHQTNWLADVGIGESIRCEAKIRYNAAPQPATAVRSDEDEVRVTFDRPQSAITPGQAVVLYQGDRLVGGGWIDSALISTSK